MSLHLSSKAVFVAACFGLLAVYPLVAGSFGVDLVTKVMVFARHSQSVRFLMVSALSVPSQSTHQLLKRLS